MQPSVEVKICGLTGRDDVAAALESGADYIGFVLYRKSPRFISASAVARILGQLGGSARAVGVFVNVPRKEVEKAAADCGLFAVQLHGDEKPGDFEGMPVPVWRAVRCKAGKWQPSPDEWKVDRFLVDAAVPGQYGGTGATADWKKAAELAARLPVMLAGGLTPENVVEAIRAVKPLGVDVVSGVESSPGRKDHAKMQRFIAAAKEAKPDGR